MEKRVDIQRIGEKRYSLDVRGYVCPYPELLTLKAIQNLSPGDILEVLLDNPPSARDVPTTMKKRGYMPDVSNVDRETWKIIVQI